MPKRIPTPPPPDDEPRYLTVVHPYPLHANLMIHADRRTLALWLACCTGKDVLLAMYYKPTSRGMVIIEVERDFDRFEMLLGSHSWSKFLSKPTGEEQDKESKVFWCHYNSGRQVQKHGWKRVDIEEHWFNGWSPNNSKITFPYPGTTWCEVPSEAKTSVPLCRPLPQAQFPTPQQAPRPAVGTPEWISAKSSDTSSVITSSSKKWDKNIAPSDSVSMISSASSGSGNNRGQSLAPSTVSTAWRMAEYRTRQDASSRGTPSIASFASPPGSRAPSTIAGSQGSRAHSSRGSTGTLARPPGLNLQYERFDWGDEVDRFEAERDDEPTSAPPSVYLGLRGSNAPRRYVPDPDGPIDPDQDYEYDEDNKPRRSMADAMKNVFDGDSDDEMIQGLGRDTRQAVDEPDPWRGYDAPKWEPPTKVNIKGGEEWKCPDHGPLCSPGICKERARVERDRRWQKEHDAREEAKRKRNEKRELARLKREVKAAIAEGREIPHDVPPHLARRWGQVSSNGGSSDDGNSTGGETEGEQGSQAGSESGEPPEPAASLNGCRPTWGGDDDDDDDNDIPKVNLGHRAPSVVTTDYDEKCQGPPSLPGDDARSVTGTNIKDSGSIVSRGTAASRQPPANARSPASVRPSAPSARGRTPAVAQSPAPGQRKSAWDTRSVANSRPTAPSASSERASRDDNVATTQPRPPPGQRQPTAKPRSPSVGTGASFSGSERPTPSYAGSISQSSSTTGQRAPERESQSSTTLHNTASSAAGRRAPTSAARSSKTSTSARTAVSSDSAPPEGGFPTFGDTEWGDPIAAAQYQRSKSKKSKKKGKDAGSDEDPETEKTNQSEGNSAGTGKKYRGWTKGRGGRNKSAPKKGGEPQPQSDSLSVAMGVDLPAFRPGSKWGETAEAW